MVAQSRHSTFEDLDDTPDDGRTYEIIDGVIVVSPAPTERHQTASLLLGSAMLGWVREAGSGTIIVAPYDVVLDEESTLQPDLAWIALENPGAFDGNRFHGAPDLVVEILSATSVTRDAMVKASRYARAGVQEFWLVDPVKESIMALDATKGLWRERPVASGGLVVSGIMVGFQVDPAALFAEVELMVSRKRR